MNDPSRPDNGMRAQDAGSEDSDVENPSANDTRAYEVRDVLDTTMAAVLQSCDMDKLARHLGLAHASHAAKLIDHPAALSRLAQRLGDGCADLPLDEAIDVTGAVLGDAGASS